MFRILRRLSLLSLVLAPLTLYFTFPRVVAKLQQDTRAANHAKCMEDAQKQPHVFNPEVPEMAKNFCDCLVEGIVLTNSDVLDILLKRMPDQLTMRTDAQISVCTERLLNPRDGDAQMIYF